MDGFFLGFVTIELQNKLLGARVDRVLQPEKDELHLLLRNHGNTYRLLLSASASHPRAHLTNNAKQNPEEPPVFCMLLRKLIGAAHVASVEQIDGDRILEITFSCVDEIGDKINRILSCEIMGRHSNIILRDQTGRILDAIRHVGANVNRVRELKPGVQFIPPPSQEKLHPLKASPQMIGEALSCANPRFDRALADCFTGISIETAKEIACRLTTEESPYLDAEARTAIAPMLYDLLHALSEEGPPVIIRNETGEIVNVFPIPQKRIHLVFQQQIPEGPSAALDTFYLHRDRRERMTQKSATLLRTIKTHIERCENKLAVHQEMLANEAEAQEARINGELLTADLHQIPKGKVQAEVRDYYSGGMRTVKLDPKLSPAQNAQKYFKQYQKMKEAQKRAGAMIDQINRELSVLEAQMDDVRKCENIQELDEIREELVRLGMLRSSHTRKKPVKKPPSMPITCRSSDGISIRVGKNSAQNDRLTLSAPPDFTWLHAKNMAGSHVTIDCTDPPESTLHEAAMLAAWFSRGYQSSNVPVDYTKRKYVKKPSGAASGFVIYTNQHTLYVTPNEHEIKRLLGEE